MCVVAPSPADLWNAISVLEEDDATHNLRLVPRKCLTNVPPPPHRALWATFGDATAAKCLGVPVGGPAARAAAFGAIAGRVADDLALVKGDGAPAFAILRFCAGFVRLVHGLRALDGPDVAEGCRAVDAAASAALARVAGVPAVPPLSSLPLRMGGSGVVSTAVMAPAARLAGRLAIAAGDGVWPFTAPPSEEDWCDCGGARRAPDCGVGRCPLCCVGRGAVACRACSQTVERAASALPPAWDDIVAHAADWAATTVVPPRLIRGFLAIAGARPQPQRALHQATLQNVRSALLASASTFEARRLESAASASARSLYTFDGLVASRLSVAAFAFGLRLRMALPGATASCPANCNCPSVAAGTNPDRLRHFATAPGNLAARALDWHARACKVGPLARGAHQTVAAAVSLVLARKGMASQWEAGGVLPGARGRRCDLLTQTPDGPLALDVARCDVEVGALTSPSGWPLLARREVAKRDSYAGLLDGMRMAPLVVDEVGRLGPLSARAVRDLANKLDEFVGAEPGTTRAELHIAIAAAVVRGQYHQLASRGGIQLPPPPAGSRRARRR